MQGENPVKMKAEVYKPRNHQKQPVARREDGTDSFSQSIEGVNSADALISDF